MTTRPWTEQAALAPGAEQKPPPAEREPFKWTWPWQGRHWTDPQPDWTRNVGKAGLGVGMAAGGAALGLGLPGLAFGASSLPGLGWLANPALAAASHPLAAGIAGGIGGLMGSANLAPGGLGVPTPGMPAGEPPTEVPTTPPGAPPTLPTPGEDTTGAGEGRAQPEVIESGGQKFWWNPTGGAYGTGGWEFIYPTTTPAPQLSPEQQIGLSEEERAHQLAMLQEQYRLEQLAMEQQGTQARGQQEAAAAQQMAQMYAADPYKYWAQMGGGTPEAVARLTGGQVGPGEQMQTGVPLSTPSAQWWGNLLPSEQQQISGGLNWMGVDPQDWYSMYQRMIPGLGQRQPGPQWAR